MCGDQIEVLQAEQMLHLTHPDLQIVYSSKGGALLREILSVSGLSGVSICPYFVASLVFCVTLVAKFETIIWIGSSIGTSLGNTKNLGWRPKGKCQHGLELCWAAC